MTQNEKKSFLNNPIRQARKKNKKIGPSPSTLGVYWGKNEQTKQRASGTLFDLFLSIIRSLIPKLQSNGEDSPSGFLFFLFDESHPSKICWPRLYHGCNRNVDFTGKNEV